MTLKFQTPRNENEIYKLFLKQNALAVCEVYTHYSTSETLTLGEKLRSSAIFDKRRAEARLSMPRDDGLLGGLG